MAKQTKKDLMIRDLQAALNHQTNLAKAGRHLAAKMFCHLVEVNKWLAMTNEVERIYGDVDTHIDFNNQMIDKIRTKLKTKQRTVTVTIND